MKILNLPLVRSMDIEKQGQLKELILSPENYGSLEYIYIIVIKKTKKNMMSFTKLNLNPMLLVTILKYQ